MSKDAKVGFGIGGVLLAVLVVYLLVVPRHHRVVHPPIAIVTPPAGAAPVSTPSQTLAVEMPTTAPSPSAAVADKPLESVTPLVPSSPSLAEPSTPTAAPLADATSTPTAPNRDWDKLFPSQSSAPGLMAPETVPQSSRSAPTFASNSGSTSDTADNTSTRSVISDSGSHRSRHAETASAASVASAGRQYSVKAGETLSSIAADVYGSSRFYVAIMRANPTLNPNRMKVGTKLTLPTATDVRPATAGGSTTEAGSSASAANDSSGAAGGGIILASQSSPTIDTIVSPDASAASDTTGFYTVKKGDTLYGISKKLYGNLHEAAAIYSTNQTVIGPDKAKLKVGTVLQLPSSGAIEAATNAVQ